MTPPQNTQQRRDDPRPSAITEVRAWILAGIAVLVQTFTIAWWGATLTAKVDNLTIVAAAASSDYKALELRVRQLEREMNIQQARP